MKDRNLTATLIPQNCKRLLYTVGAVILLVTVLGYVAHNQEGAAHRRLPTSANPDDLALAVEKLDLENKKIERLIQEKENKRCSLLDKKVKRNKDTMKRLKQEMVNLAVETKNQLIDHHKKLAAEAKLLHRYLKPEIYEEARNGTPLKLFCLNCNMNGHGDSKCPKCHGDGYIEVLGRFDFLKKTNEALKQVKKEMVKDKNEIAKVEDTIQELSPEVQVGVRVSCAGSEVANGEYRKVDKCCPKCQGKGTFEVEEGQNPCVLCSGTGMVPKLINKKPLYSKMGKDGKRTCNTPFIYYCNGLWILHKGNAELYSSKTTDRNGNPLNVEEPVVAQEYKWVVGGTVRDPDRGAQPAPTIEYLFEPKELFEKKRWAAHARREGQSHC